MNAPCGMNGGAARFAALWMALLDERAKLMHCDKRLVICAQNHANYLIGRRGDQLQQSMHVGLGGTMPNKRARQAGYVLPDWYADEDNNIECCYRGQPEPSEALTSLMNSDHHRPALMGEGFWEDAVFYGVGTVGTDFVVLVCPAER